jgi:hypothetical protein
VSAIVRVGVTWPDIKAGSARGDRGRGSFCYCPAARALCRATGKDLGYWWVGRETCWTDTLLARGVVIALPEPARLWVDAHEHYRDIRPFAFDLDLRVTEAAGLPEGPEFYEGAPEPGAATDHVSHWGMYTWRGAPFVKRDWKKERA